jgi:tRNA (cmo5U34)-methyltransferase
MTGETLDAEQMAAFFDRRADSYDAHMRRVVTDFDGFYRAVAQPIERTEKAITILDLGCGTGLELGFIFDRAPNGQVTAVDLSREMLSRLSEKYADRSDQLTVIATSYLALAIEPARWDHIVSAMTMHHLTYGEKLRLYRAIRRGLKPGGSYIEGDYVVSREEAAEHLARYQQFRREHPGVADGAYHVDIPFCIETQLELLSTAGFSEADVVWQAGAAAVFVAGR